MYQRIHVSGAQKPTAGWFCGKKKNNIGEYRNYTQPDNQIIAEILQLVFWSRRSRVETKKIGLDWNAYVWIAFWKIDFHLLSWDISFSCSFAKYRVVIP